MGHVFLGVTIVGIVMIIRIIFEGLSALQDLRKNILAARGTIVMNQSEIKKEKEAGESLAKLVHTAQKEVDDLTKQETETTDQIRNLQAELDKDQYY